MAILTVHHTTRYRYRKPVTFGEHRIMFRPLESYDQHLQTATLVVTPEPDKVRYVHDVFGNCVGLITVAAPSDTLTFESKVRLEHTPGPLNMDADEEIDGSRATFPFAYGAEDMPDLLRSIERQHSDPDHLVHRWARQFVGGSGSMRVLDVLAAMTKAIHKDFEYASRLQVGTQTPLETLSLNSGSCRDFAVLMIDAVRSLGFAAQFVSGYIYSPTTEGEPHHVGGGHTHAWVRVYLPSCGWTEFDPTNGIVGNHDLIRVAVARDPRQAIPLCGTWDGDASDYLDMEVEVDVRVQGERKALRRVA
jgi:transglutaminase-like putative cysteine protease